VVCNTIPLLHPETPPNSFRPLAPTPNRPNFDYSSLFIKLLMGDGQKSTIEISNKIFINISDRKSRRVKKSIAAHQ
jgi:hypothetical protein